VQFLKIFCSSGESCDASFDHFKDNWCDLGYVNCQLQDFASSLRLHCVTQLLSLTSEPYLLRLGEHFILVKVYFFGLSNPFYPQKDNSRDFHHFFQKTKVLHKNDLTVYCRTSERNF